MLPPLLLPPCLSCCRCFYSEVFWEIALKKSERDPKSGNWFMISSGIQYSKSESSESKSKINQSFSWQTLLKYHNWVLFVWNSEIFNNHIYIKKSIIWTRSVAFLISYCPVFPTVMRTLSFLFLQLHSLSGKPIPGSYMWQSFFNSVAEEVWETLVFPHLHHVFCLWIDSSWNKFKGLL